MGSTEHDLTNQNPRVSVYKGDEINAAIKGYVPKPERVPEGSNIQGVYFDGYPQIIKEEESESTYQLVIKKDVMVTMRDGIQVAIDIYKPDAQGEQFPTILAWGEWGKDAQDIVMWMWDKPQQYFETPFWNGSLEGCNFLYTVARGYIHIIGEPRGVGNSQGVNSGDESLHSPQDIYDTVEWIAKQPWSNGKVCMMGPSSYARAQLKAGQEPSPHLLAIRPDEAPEPFAGEDFHGMWDTLLNSIHCAKHANDHLPPASHNTSPAPPPAQEMTCEQQAQFQRGLKEALEDPDIKYNPKFYAEFKYPNTNPMLIHSVLYHLHPKPVDAGFQNIKVPIYIGTPWCNRLYAWGTFEAYQKANVPDKHKKLIVYPPMFPARPYVWYHDEAIRWFDYWLKGKDTGIVDEPPIKMFVMGINKWKFESEWPLARTQWTKYYLKPQGELSTDPVSKTGQTESFTQPAPYLDPTVYCLRYRTKPFEKETEITGPVALHLDASIDIDDTNWMAELVDVDPDGNRQLLSLGYLKAKFKALDEEKTQPHRPIHPRQEPVPVVPGEVNRYSIGMLPTANVFKKGHSMEVIIKNQEDLLSRLGCWGVNMLPFMQTVTHTIHFGESHLVLPIIPG